MTGTTTASLTLSSFRIHLLSIIYCVCKRLLLCAPSACSPTRRHTARRLPSACASRLRSSLSRNAPTALASPSASNATLTTSSPAPPGRHLLYGELGLVFSSSLPSYYRRSPFLATMAPLDNAAPHSCNLLYLRRGISSDAHRGRRIPYRHGGGGAPLPCNTHTLVALAPCAFIRSLHLPPPRSCALLNARSLPNTLLWASNGWIKGSAPHTNVARVRERK